jgi:RNA polymerase sigma factor (TIGR02999 family)
VSDVTRILSHIEQGDAQAAEMLLPLVYDELRKLAAAKLAQEKPGQTLQATALVHEAYLRLVDVDKAQDWDTRRHFFAAAAEAMRRILIEKARSKGRQKRGGVARQVDLDENDWVTATTPDQLLAVDEALARLALEDQAAAEALNCAISPECQWTKLQRRWVFIAQLPTDIGLTLARGFVPNYGPPIRPINSLSVSGYSSRPMRQIEAVCRIAMCTRPRAEADDEFAIQICQASFPGGN